ncbi:MAG: DUF3237 family protein [Stellaceae bacterium]
METKDWRAAIMIPALETEFVFQIRVDFKERLMFGETPRGGRGYVPPVGGWIDGPRLKGKVRAYTGADWAWIRPDGVLELDARYMLEADDGTPIYIQNRGYLYRHTGDHVPIRGAGDANTPHYFAITPTFDVPKGKHDWLARTIIVGNGVRHTDPDHTMFTYYAVR